MSSYNHVAIIGNLTRDPELRYTPKGTAVAKFTLAVNETYTDQDGKKHESCNFIDVTAWGRQAEVIAQYLKKGKPLMVDGRLNQESWEDRTTKEKKSKLAVVLEKFVFIGGKDDSAGTQKTARPETKESGTPIAGDEQRESDDVPF